MDYQSQKQRNRRKRPRNQQLIHHQKEKKFSRKLGPEFDDFYLKKKYNDGILTHDEACLFAHQCLNIGSAALPVLKYLHNCSLLLSFKLLDSLSMKRHVYQNIARIGDEPPKHEHLLSTDWITSPGILDMVKYLHEEMKITGDQLLAIPYFDINLMTASGNVDLIKYLYKIGLKSSDFIKTFVPISGTSGTSSWCSIQDSY